MYLSTGSSAAVPTGSPALGGPSAATKAAAVGLVLQYTLALPDTLTWLLRDWIVVRVTDVFVLLACFTG